MKTLVLSLFCLIFISRIATPQTNQILSLDGNGDYITLPASSSITQFTNQITIEGWIKVESFPATGNASHIISTSNQNDFDATITSLRQFTTHLYPLGQFTSKSLININTWTHVCMTYDNTYRKIYINGILDTVISQTGNFSGSPQAKYPVIGAYYSTSSYIQFFNGKMDELRVWNIARTQIQIQQNLYQSLANNDRTGLVGYWRFEGNYADSSVYGNNGTAIGNATRINLYAPFWQFGKSVDFTNQGAIRVSKKNNSLNITGNTITVEALIKPTSSGFNWGRVFIGGDINSTYTMQEYSSNPIRIIWRPLGGTNNNLSSRSSLTSNIWYHVAGTYDGTTSKIYVNGILDTSFSMTGNIPLNNNDAWIGGDLGSPLSYLYSRLDEIRVWNIVRSQTQLQQNIFKELNQSDTAGLVGYWKLNGNAKDNSSRGNDGYLCGSAQYDTANAVISLLQSPILLSPSNGSSNLSLTPTLFWNTVANATSYTVQVSPTNTFSGLLQIEWVKRPLKSTFKSPVAYTTRLLA